MTTLNPAKKFLFRELRAFLKKDGTVKKIGIDVACENFKNARYFVVKKYIGIDIREQIIKSGLNNYKEKKYLGIKFDYNKKRETSILKY